MSFYNTGQETKTLETAYKIQSLFRVGYVFGPWQMILEPTW